MTAPVLDKTRHFCQIYGATDNGAVYHQDGIDFRGDGSPILSDEAQETIAAIDAALAAEQAAVKSPVSAKAKPGKAKATDASPADVEDLA